MVGNKKANSVDHYFADSRGYPESYAYDSIVEEYGEPQARIILAAAQIMIAGNMYGIPYSAFQSRLKEKPFQGSSLPYELGMLTGGIIFFANCNCSWSPESYAWFIE